MFSFAGGTLSLPSVFYVISLLHLPKLSLACFFVKAVKAWSETAVSARRINKFLLQPEASDPQDVQGPLALLPFPAFLLFLSNAKYCILQICCK